MTIKGRSPHQAHQAAPTPPNGYANGISADNFGTGSTFVTTAVRTQIHSGGDGIFAFDGGPATPSGSVVSVIAHGNDYLRQRPERRWPVRLHPVVGYNDILSTPTSLTAAISVTSASTTLPDDRRRLRRRNSWGFNYGTGASCRPARSDDHGRVEHTEMACATWRGRVRAGRKPQRDQPRLDHRRHRRDHRNDYRPGNREPRYLRHSDRRHFPVRGFVGFSPTITNELGPNWSLNGSNQRLRGSACSFTNDGTIDSPNGWR